MKLPDRPRTRFAPSPTGLLHLGHVANAVWVWGLAQASRGTVVLRMEDHDRLRCRPEFEDQILRDLEWLSLEPDLESRVDLDRHPSRYRQSDCDDRYRSALELLHDRGRVYRCECSRKTLAAAAPDLPDLETPYPGVCRPKNLAEKEGLSVRLVVPDDSVTFTDLRLGEITQHPAAQCGDFALRDRNGHWTYQHCVVVDDMAHQIDLVVRGEDLLPSTGRQILLGKMLGQTESPRFLHHPLIRDPNGQKLSKRDRAAGLAVLRARGLAPEEVLGLAAHATGLRPDRRPIAGDQLGALFSSVEVIPG